ncbi:MAG: alpha/beta fold hydrolase [Bacteroidota bacterium]
MKYIEILFVCLLMFSCEAPPTDILYEKITERGIHANLLHSPGNRDHPLVLLVPGSGASFLPNKLVSGLVKSGYDVLSIAYKGQRGLPKKIERIPLEYLETVINYANERFPERKLVLLGISKGAEYALTFASYYDLVDGLIAYAPSAFVLPNHVSVQKSSEQHSSWTWQGQEIPFAKLAPFQEPAGMVTYRHYISPIFTDSIPFNQARIHVEKIRCRILLLSGADDQVWPASDMGSMIQSIIESVNPTLEVEHISYPDCGHQFVWFHEQAPDSAPVYQSMRLTGIKRHKFVFGGTEEATRAAMVDSRKQILRFLAEF